MDGVLLLNGVTNATVLDAILAVIPPQDVIVIPNHRWMVRTGHIDALGETAIDDLRITIKRGIGTNTSEPVIMVRVNRNNMGFGRWIKRGLGKSGQRVTSLNFGGMGSAHTWQWEIVATDDCEVELQDMEVLATELGH
jgi:hypothetical protein